MSTGDVGKKIVVWASLATIIGVCIAAVALIPAFGQWLLPREPSPALVTPVVRPTDTPPPATVATDTPSVPATATPLPTNTPTPSATPPPTNTPLPTATPDCSLTTELGPWTTVGNVLVDARDSWVQADFWSSVRTLREGYDEVSVLFEPGLKVEVVNVAGNGWQYSREWTRQDIEFCITKHINDSWNIRHKKLVYITVTELCASTECR